MVEPDSWMMCCWSDTVGDRSSTPPRKELFGGPNFLISGDYKLLLGEAVTYAVWTGPQSPNATTDATKQFFLQWNCSECQPPVTMGRINCSKGCLCAHKR